MPLPENWPTGLDALADPGAATYTDDPGYFLDEVIARIHNLLEKMEARLGIGAASGTPAANTVYAGTAAGTSAWLAGLTAAYLAPGAVAKRQLNYTQVGNVYSGIAMTASTWYTLTASQPFSLDAAGSLVLIAVRGNVPVGGLTSTAEVGTRVLVDGAAHQLGGAWIGAGAGDYGNGLAGAGLLALTGLAAGAHTVEPQVMCSGAGTLWLRPATVPDYEKCAVVVVELKQSL